MKKYFGLGLAALALTGCESKKIPITGTRIAVVSYESNIKVDEDVKGKEVFLPLTEMGKEWPQMGGEADHTLPHFSLDEKPKLHWTSSIGTGNGSGRLLSTPIVKEGIIYSLDTEGVVSALQSASGEKIWQLSIARNEKADPIIGGGLAYGNGKIYVTSPYAEVLALDSKTGKILWRFGLQSPVRAAPTYADGRLFVLSISNQLDVLDAENGKRLWEHAGITENAGLLGTASPAVSKGIAIVTYSSGEIFALKADNGQQLWSETLSPTRRPDSLSSISHIRALPIISDNRVIVIGHNQKMATYDLLKGERVWERNIGGTRTPAVVGDFIFMVNSHNELLCLTKDYGQVVWIQKLESDTESPTKVIWQGPIVAGNKLHLINAKGKLVSIDPSTGKMVSEQMLDVPLSLPPIIANETLYILNDNGDLMAFH